MGFSTLNRKHNIDERVARRSTTVTNRYNIQEVTSNKGKLSENASGFHNGSNA